MSEIIQETAANSKKTKTPPSRFVAVLKRGRGVSVGVVLLVLLIFLFILSFTLGRYYVSPSEVIHILFSHIFTNVPPSIPDSVVMQIRLPRILAAMLVGATLSLAGASFQGLFRNPLVSPDILGVSAGAGFGAALAILFSGSRFTIQISAFCFALLAVTIAYAVSRVVKGHDNLSLILAGLAISSLFNASLSLMEYVANPVDQLPTIIYWLMGSLASLSLEDMFIAAVPMVIGIIILLLMRWRFNVLAMGEEEAQSMGVNVSQFRIIIVICCTMISAAAVCISGIIGWVGLVIPHISRLLVGPDHKRLLPVCLLLGALYLLLIDDIARTASSLEIPLGILTAMIGAPFFIYMLSRRGKGWT